MMSTNRPMNFVNLSICANGLESENPLATPANPNILNVINPETFMNPQNSILV